MEQYKPDIFKNETAAPEKYGIISKNMKSPEELMDLAKYGQDIVRLCIAKDENTPEEVIDHLAKNDPNEGVRRMARRTKTNIFLGRF